MSGSWPMVVVLTVIWVLLWGAVTPTIVVGGVLAAVLVVTVFPFPRAPWTWVVRPWPTLVLAVRFLWDLVRASVEVSWFAVRPSGPPPSALLRIDLRSRSELLMTITSELVCLVPGSLLVELDSEEGAIYLHVMSAATDERHRGVPPVGPRAGAAGRQGVRPPRRARRRVQRGARMTVVGIVCAALLALSGALCLIRVVRGPSMLDRTVATDVFVAAIVGAVGVHAAVGRYSTTVVGAARPVARRLPRLGEHRPVRRARR